MADGADTTNELYAALKSSPNVKVLKFDAADLKAAQQKGSIAGVLNIIKTTGAATPFKIEFKSTTSSNDRWPQFKALLEGKITATSLGTLKSKMAYVGRS